MLEHPSDLNLPPSRPPENQRLWLRWLLIGGALFGLVGIICCGFAVFGGVRLFQNLQAESDAIQPTLRAFLDAGQRGDAAAALRLFADDAAASVSLADLDRLFMQRPAIFAAYTDITIDSINVFSGTEGTTANIAGMISYRDGAPSRSYTAALRKEGGTWMLTQIQFPDGVGT